MKKNILEINEGTTRASLVVGVFYETVSIILFPLVVFGGLGWVLDQNFETERFFLFSGIAIAFFVTQILIFVKIRKFLGRMGELSKVRCSQKDKGE